MSIATLILTTTHLTNFSNSDAHEQDIPQTPSYFERVCLDCGKLIQNPYNINSTQSLFDFLNVEFDDDQSVCCFNNTEQMALIVDYILKEQQTETTPPKPQTNVPHEPIAAHKNLVRAKANEVRSGRNSCLQHNISKNFNEHVNGIAVMDHGLVIQYTGMYYVYSSVRFTSTKQDTPFTTHNFIVQLISQSKRSTTILLRSYTSGSKTYQESSFTGGAFYLDTGDVVQVCVSDPGMVQPSEATYAGLIMIGSHTESK